MEDDSIKVDLKVCPSASEPHPFDDLKVSESVKWLEESMNWKDRPTLRSPLYYLNFFQYRAGDLYRAMLGYEVIWDREFEEDCMKRLDEVLQRETHACQVWKYEGKKSISLRGIFWRWNNWKLPRAHCTIILRPSMRELIWTRRIGDKVDIEGPITLRSTSTPRHGVLTVSYYAWKKRFEPLFKEVKLENKDGRSTYQSQSTPWRIINAFPDGVPDVRYEDRKRIAEETGQPVSKVRSYVRDRVVRHPWKVSGNLPRPNVVKQANEIKTGEPPDDKK